MHAYIIYTDAMRHIHQFSIILYENEKRLHLHDFQFNTQFLFNLQFEEVTSILFFVFLDFLSSSKPKI